MENKIIKKTKINIKKAIESIVFNQLYDCFYIQMYAYVDKHSYAI